MELSIDGVLTVINIIYKTCELYATNSENLNNLIQKIKFFELPLLKLKATIQVDQSMEMHINNLYILLDEVKLYLEDHIKKNKVKKFFSAIFIDDKVREFDDRIEEIKRNLNFEFDLNNHLIFHSFNNTNKEINQTIFNIMDQLKTKKDILYPDYIFDSDCKQSFRLIHYFEARMQTYQQQVNSRLSDFKKTIDHIYLQNETDEKKYLKLEDGTDEINDESNDESNDDSITSLGERPSLTPAPLEKGFKLPRPKNRGPKKSEKYRQLQKFLELSEKHYHNIPLKRHIDMIIMLLILEDYKGYYVFDGNLIQKKLNFICEDGIEMATINILDFNKGYKVNMEPRHLKIFLLEFGFAVLSKEYRKFSSDCVFEIKEYYDIHNE
jgi:hypothetical protein